MATDSTGNADAADREIRLGAPLHAAAVLNQKSLLERNGLAETARVGSPGYDGVAAPGEVETGRRADEDAAWLAVAGDREEVGEDFVLDGG